MGIFNEYFHQVLVQSEREDIKSIHFGKTMTITYDDGHYCEYSYQLIKTTIRKKKVS